MYAVLRTGGKQYRVSANDVIIVEKLPGEEGGFIEFDDVLMIGDGKATTLGTPLLEGALVTATILEQGRADKILVFKKKRRQNYRRMHGHRQAETVLRINEVLLPGAERKPQKAAAKEKAPAAKEKAPVAKAKAPAAKK
jgi:large subunit ribosomal protein L21